jgi:hypothetical protein
MYVKFQRAVYLYGTLCVSEVGWKHKEREFLLSGCV